MVASMYGPRQTVGFAKNSEPTAISKVLSFVKILSKWAGSPGVVINDIFELNNELNKDHPDVFTDD